MTVEEKLVEMLEREMKMEHVELHAVRLAFLNRVWYCANRDISFRELVTKQLDLYCGVPDPRAFVEHCNTPKHLIRNRMLSWDIDHPVKEES